jgi:hypothetical protein
MVVNTPRYSEVLLAGARDFYLSLLERIFHVKILCPVRVFFIILRYLLVAFITSAPRPVKVKRVVFHVEAVAQLPRRLLVATLQITVLWWR